MKWTYNSDEKNEIYLVIIKWQMKVLIRIKLLWSSFFQNEINPKIVNCIICVQTNI